MAKNSNRAVAAKKFAEKWEGLGYEKGQSQTFWLELLQSVYGVQDPFSFIEFEGQIKNRNSTSFMDAYIPSTKVLIEQKSLDKDLGKEILQSDGSTLTPYEQAKKYVVDMPVSKHPRWVVTCNFQEFRVYDMENPQGEPEIIKLKDLEKEHYRLSFLVDDSSVHTKKEVEVSMAAGRIIGDIYDAFLKEYRNPDDPHTLRSLNILCVRLVFCLYAEDAGLFEGHSQFHDYLVQFKPGTGDMRRGLLELFDVLNTPIAERDPYLPDNLQAFPYVNGGLFAEQGIEVPRFNETIANLLLKHASDDFDWSEISPTIFGGVFESTLNPETRRSGGMHYTSIENSHKVIDPLFLDELKKELDEIKAEPSEKKRIQKAQEFQDKLAGLKFLDPACGSGNFLTETFLSLRRLENEAIRIIHRGQMMIGEFVNPIKVSINQFYGIEINDFAVSVAMTALWIAEAQMLFETEKIMQISLDFLPLKNYSNIKEGNALRLDWSYWENDDDSTVVLAEHTHIYPVQTIPEDTLQEPVVKYGSVDVYSPDVQIHTTGKGKAFRRVKFDYIMGNPPFLGARVMSAAQKDDLINVFGPKWKNVGNMDYVTGWYKKSLEMMLSNPQVRAALVSTNSITQGEQVANLWRPLMEAGIHIDFAWRTFIWDSEANQKAHVHCVIIGFSICHSERKRRIFDGNTVIEAANINGYLVDAPSVAIDNRTKPICDVPEMVFGSMPNDGGFLSNYSDEDRQIIITQYPQALPLFKRLLGATEFINNTIRWCIWLKGVSPLDYIKIPPIMEAISKVREMRQNSSRKSTRKLSDTPMLFGEIRQPESEYLLVPSTSSENRSYIPIGFISPEIISNNANLLVPHASMYTFGIMTSSVHMAWMRIVCGRLKSDYRYSANIVYNNFPWPAPTEEQKARIEQTAQAILDARQLYADASFADLYGNLIIFPELTKAHRANDAAVMEAYGFRKDMTEPEIVAELFKMYQKLANN